MAVERDEVPAHIDGTVLISASDLTYYEMAPSSSTRTEALYR